MSLLAMSPTALASFFAVRPFPNKFPGGCAACAARVGSGAGYTRKAPQGFTGAWIVTCPNCEVSKGKATPKVSGGVQLSDQQLAIVHAVVSGESIFVRARAGTGKTFTLVKAMEAVSADLHSGVAVLAFNKTMGAELARKMPKGVGFVRTIDALAHRAFTALYGKDGFVIDNFRERKIAKALVRDAGLFGYAGLASAAGLARTFRDESDEGIASRAESFGIEFPVRNVDGVKVQVDAAEFVALVHVALKALRVPQFEGKKPVVSFVDMHEAIANGAVAASTFSVIVIDEAQDTSPLQVASIQRALRAAGQIIAVGDDRQAIYRFRGADPLAVENLIATFALRVLPLTITRRCPKSVVALAQEVVPDFEAADDAPEGSVEFAKDWTFDDVAQGEWVISRSNGPLVKMAMQCIKRRTAFRFLGRDALASIRTWLLDLVPGRTIQASMERLDDMTGDALVSLARVESDRLADIALDNENDREAEAIRDRFDVINALGSGKSRGGDIIRGLDEIGGHDDDGTGEGADVITLTTVHQAKGKEGNVIHILKPTFYIRGGDPIEEENLWYVGITRTKDTLVIADFPKRKR